MMLNPNCDSGLAPFELCFCRIQLVCVDPSVDTFTWPLNCYAFTDDGTYALKKVLIQNNEQLESVREEIRVSYLFNHPNLLPLLDHAIIAVKVLKLTLAISV